jgi:cytochrome P450
MTEDQKSRYAYHLDNTDPSIAPQLFQTLQDVQRKCPVAWSDAVGGFWALTKYDDLTQAANDWETFTVEEGHTIPSTGKSVMLPIAEVDPPEHTAWRKFLLPYFTTKGLQKWIPQLNEIVADAFAELRASGHGDILKEVAHRVPTSAISAILGFKRDWVFLSDIAEEWLASTSDTSNRKRALEAAAIVEGVIKDEIEMRRGKRAEDILGELMHTEVNGRPMTEDELLGLCIVFIIAGHGTTVDGIANTVHRMLVEPGLLKKMESDRTIVPSVIDESLRISPPVWNMGRTVRNATEVRGVGMCPGEKVMLTFGAGNYDPEKFADPETFDFTRPGVHGHLTFGYGRHRCIGETLAKLEIRLVVEYILDNLPDLALDGEAGVRMHFSSYGLARLPVRRTSVVGG